MNQTKQTSQPTNSTNISPIIQNYTLPPLGYDYGALEPIIDKETMTIHHTKHHQAYVDKLNAALQTLTPQEIEAIIAQKINLNDINSLLINLEKLPTKIKSAVQNHGGGHHNHTLFWQIIAPHTKNQSNNDHGSSQPKESIPIIKEINKTFTNFSNFREQISAAAMNRFGSGWAWLVWDIKTKKLEIMSTANQDSPLSQNKIPIIGIDVWEHAYYLKYQNRRAQYLESFCSIINWDVVNTNYLNAIK